MSFIAFGVFGCNRVDSFTLMEVLGSVSSGNYDKTNGICFPGSLFTWLRSKKMSGGRLITSEICLVSVINRSWFWFSVLTVTFVSKPTADSGGVGLTLEQPAWTLGNTYLASLAISSRPQQEQQRFTLKKQTNAAVRWTSALARAYLTHTHIVWSAFKEAHVRPRAEKYVCPCRKRALREDAERGTVNELQ